MTMAAVMTGPLSLAAETSPTTTFDDLWSHAILYQNKANPILQEFALQGRLQLQYAVGSSEQGQFTSGDLQDIGTDTWGQIDVRRWYMGFKATMFQNLKLQGEAIINPDWGPVYGGLFDFTATWNVCDQLQLNAGKLEVRFSKEFEVSSKEIVTIERSLLNNQLSPRQLTGAWVNGKNVAGFWNYELGVYASDIQEEFTEFQGGAIILGKIGYDFAAATGLEKAAVEVQWMHSTDPGVAGAKAYDNSFDLTGEIKQGRWAAISDVLYATGQNDLTGAPVPDVWGISLIPTYNLTDKLQLVARYQFARANGDGGLKLQTHYELTAPDLVTASGNQYQAGYLGVNYYIYGHKLKLMTGVEYSDMQDNSTAGGGYDGWTWMSGARMYF
jgi:phosphate-selective porin OprO/OprP